MKLIQVAKAAALAACALTAGSMAAESKTVTPVQPAQCKFGTQLSGADVWNSTACVNQIGGNDSDKTVGNGVTNVNTVNGGLFGFTNWTLNSRYEDTGTYSTVGLLTGTGAAKKSGTWSVSSWKGIGAAMLVVKGGNGFASYLLDLTAGLSGGWSMAAVLNNGGKIPDMSHISLYTVPGAPAAVPVPAAGLLLVGALGGLAAVRSRKRKA